MFRASAGVLVLLPLAAFLIAGASWAGWDESSAGTAEPRRPIEIEVESARRKTRPAGVDELMQKKLENFTQIMEGLVRHDCSNTAEAASRLKLLGLTLPKGWQKSDEDVEIYQHFRTEFMRQAARLEEEARAERLAGAAYFQQQLTATCIACHDYIRDENRFDNRTRR